MQPPLQRMDRERRTGHKGWRDDRGVGFGKVGICAPKALTSESSMQRGYTCVNLYVPRSVYALISKLNLSRKGKKLRTEFMRFLDVGEIVQDDRGDGACFNTYKETTHSKEQRFSYLNSFFTNIVTLIPCKLFV